MTPAILNILYIAGAAIGAFVLFCLAIWGAYWKIAQGRKKDKQKQDDSIAKAKSDAIKVATDNRSDLESINDRQWAEINRVRKEGEAELERKADQLHKRLEDVKDKAHAESLQMARDLGKVEGKVEILCQKVIK